MQTTMLSRPVPAVSPFSGTPLRDSNPFSLVTLGVRAGATFGETGEAIQREEDTSGPDGTGYSNEPEPEARFHRLVRHLVADGDRRAARLGRQARRTLDEMWARPGTEAAVR
ncbi:hypothetical protein [Streptomyces sp. CAU 1734]|uniref:hypothetical protein n=1 Tax=Streptomyces sp. CAU 1734 TaxID=3140360 RepID=UPI0032604CFD